MTLENVAGATSRSHLMTSGLLVAVLSGACAIGCSSDDAERANSRGTDGGGNPSGAAGGHNPFDTGGTTASGGAAFAGADSGGVDIGGASSTGGTPPVEYSEVGVCGQRGQGTVDQSTFAGYEEFYLIGEEGFGDEICVVRFEVSRVGPAPDGCDDPTADVDCVWTHLVEYGAGEVLTDVDGTCANSELGFDAARIDEVTGSQSAYGFVSEYAGHNSVLMAHDPATGSWDAFGNATWDPDSGAFRFDRRNGFCGY